MVTIIANGTDILSGVCLTFFSRYLYVQGVIVKYSVCLEALSYVVLVLGTCCVVLGQDTQLVVISKALSPWEQ